MSDSVQPHRQQPTRLHCPWDSPGKNTGVGCYFLLQCMKVKSESEVAQSCPTLSNPSLPGSSIHGILQAGVLEWGTIAIFLRHHKTRNTFPASFYFHFFLCAPSQNLRIIYCVTAVLLSQRKFCPRVHLAKCLDIFDVSQYMFWHAR